MRPETTYCRHIVKGTIYPWNENLDANTFERIYGEPDLTATVSEPTTIALPVTVKKEYVMKPYKPRIKKGI